MIPSIRGNSPVAIARRAGQVTRRNNAWKVRAGELTQKELRRWVRSVERMARQDPELFAPWHGVVKAA